MSDQDPDEEPKYPEDRTKREPEDDELIPLEK